ncbi:lysophospholipase L1-like esterase [Algoriphagus ratkowskyi]|uniref:Lysophospholipase L1-like esterase n=1 Tax=Algoriphagus ratkowskyi TaxID=57028 RepID=A0A2W7RKA9_9BACT|nr:SGNH/GDSL hydrolase family protein [Algoriphagus ratkowskyi]PZX51105.1 lysophospholipase L1-like esterase [Algoriphagus ratkowskyi]TXD75893.1 SGNH/GDSL hydrolase family protein [Algoriphagus ratkowskyi]
MIRVALVLLFALGFHVSSISQTVGKIPKDVQRIIFLGNSITYSGQYISFVETYFRLNHPDRGLEWINVGLPSETVSGLSEENHAGGAFPRPDLQERLDRVLDQLSPDLVFVNYGMNDGIYLPLDRERFQKYKDGINWLDEKIKGINAQAIFVTPPVYDPKKGSAYANVLDNYSDWLLSRRYTDGWEVIDIHWPMRKYLEDQRALDSTYFLAKDGVHPGEMGHWLMAKEILLGLGEAEVQDFNGIQEAIASFANGEEILALISQRQVLLRDAWLSATGHQRPGITEGISLKDAELQSNEIESKIKGLLDDQK